MKLSCLLFALAACTPGMTGGGGGDDWDRQLDERAVDYPAALRIASLRLTGALPTLAQIHALAGAADPQAAYAAQVQAYLDDPRFATRMVAYWRDTFRLGDDPSLDTAPVFAAQLTVENRAYTELLTATAGTCPTFDGATFTAADCANGVPVAAGVLTNPGVQALLMSNLAFRRVRWVQETFACTAFPAETVSATRPEAPTYRSPWPMDSIAGFDNGGTIDFHDQSAVICANCHATMNHLAPLFARFDGDGVLQPDVAVHTPLDGAPLAVRTDWLPGAEPTAWRFGVPAPDLPALGAAMAADPAIAECAVARLWNWALGKGDVVDTLALVPAEVIAAQVDAFRAGGMKPRAAILAIFTSDDFVRF